MEKGSLCKTTLHNLRPNDWIGFYPHTFSSYIHKWLNLDIRPPYALNCYFEAAAEIIVVVIVAGVLIVNWLCPLYSQLSLIGHPSLSVDFIEFKNFVH